MPATTADVVLFDIPQVCDRLGNCSRSHAYRLIASGLLRCVDISDKGSTRPKTRVRSDDLAAYISSITPSK